MIFWNVREIEKCMATRGWTNARQLAQGAGISYPAAWAIAQGGAIGRVDVRTLEALTKAFRLREPWALLDYVED